MVATKIISADDVRFCLDLDSDFGNEQQLDELAQEASDYVLTTTGVDYGKPENMGNQGYTLAKRVASLYVQMTYFADKDHDFKGNIDMLLHRLNDIQRLSK